VVRYPPGIPRKHYQGVEDVPMALADKLWRLSTALAKIYRNELKATGVNVITNSGRPAGQEIFHFHISLASRAVLTGPVGYIQRGSRDKQ